MSENKFVDGLIVKPPRDGAPSFVKATISIKRRELIGWLEGREGDWVNLDVKSSGKDPGKWYASVNEWKRDEAAPKKEQPAPASDFVDDDVRDLPF